MKLLFFVDARSTIAGSWIRHFIADGHEVHVVSSHACDAHSIPGARLYQLPIAFGRIRRPNNNGNGAHSGAGLVRALQRLDRATQGLIRSWLTPIDVLPHIPRLRRLFDAISPDLVHAMRIPYEGIMASLTVGRKPLVISCWGNDFTLFTSAPSDRFLTRHAIRRADALHCDCERDVRLARQWGFAPDKPSIVLPTAGGVDTSVFHPGKPELNGYRLGFPEDARIIINPRGMRMYVRNDSFFRAIPIVLRQEPRTFFICPAMQDEPYAQKMIRKLYLSDHVRLLPKMERGHLAEMFRAAQVSVSPSTHDGTPNSLLETMATGCFPVAGDIESVREWIEHGVNGLLCDPASPESIAAALIQALRNPDLRRRAAQYNVKLAAERAEYGKVMVRAGVFYQQVLERVTGITPKTETGGAK
jgi:glycosyltransferase involved in cell wall biosynthesis